MGHRPGEAQLGRKEEKKNSKALIECREEQWEGVFQIRQTREQYVACTELQAESGGSYKKIHRGVVCPKGVIQWQKHNPAFFAIIPWKL